MVRFDVDIRGLDEGHFNAYAAAPASPNGLGVVVLQEIFGVNANIRATVDAFADNGFFAAAPDLFWRQEPGLQLDPGVEADRSRGMALLAGLNEALAVEDVIATAAWLRTGLGKHPKVAVVGYCMGGKLAYLAATHAIDAAVSYYGVGIQNALDRADGLNAPLLLHIAEADVLCPPEAQDRIRAAFGARRGVEVMSHPGVGHAFARRESPAYVAAAADRADDETLRFLLRQLAPS